MQGPGLWILDPGFRIQHPGPWMQDPESNMWIELFVNQLTFLCKLLGVGLGVESLSQSGECVRLSKVTYLVSNAMGAMAKNVSNPWEPW